VEFLMGYYPVLDRVPKGRDEGDGCRQPGCARNVLARTEDAMLIQHQHKPGRFDPGHCRGCARESDLLDHYWRVQREEQAFKEAHWWARRAQQWASWALWCSGIGIVLAVVALLTG
jgi:hypothetical protein